MGITRVGSFDQNVCVAEHGLTPQRLFGVQSFDGSWDLPLNPVKAAGHGMINHDPQGPVEGSVSVSRFITEASSDDPLINYSAGGGLLTVPISGFLVYGPSTFNQGFSFEGARVTSYSSSCDVGGIASSDFTLTVYGNMVSGSGASTFPTRDPVGVARANSLQVEVLGSGSNAIQGYDFQLQLDWTPLYGFGASGQPVGYRLNYPLEITVDFEMIVDHYNSADLSGLLCERNPETLNILARTGCGEELGVHFQIANAELKSTS